MGNDVELAVAYVQALFPKLPGNMR